MKLPDDPALATATLDTPIGRLRLAATEAGLAAILFPNQKDVPLSAREGSAKARAHLDKAVKALNRYFEGKERDFSGLTLAAEGTAFQKSVWAALARIPFGETRSYADIARAIGNPKGVRAVGLANGRNPIPIVVPCHRVIGADGSLTGFGGGLPTKKWLLEFEGIETPSFV
ncbi:methylated-DNA--[protein]-cysteine S-methyltransferase [Parvibaculum sp.]|jgi:methylated-DNA-[protein]-cysteine S-methyltransferase|uniref:methylated-DNA--[protein]-cysteine S-methyltransferase n=1 Tax=Parvibaculum sp. TaxID=2024848 RepID=UPI000C69E8B9|nr:methylated-DNA--[protein]-cysteine S-methyltransferase [Parvibaculum sp.]HAC59812.1 cysteine methyltransferase [Rhodobiaceae bacterium]MAU61475.1 cysteine methyltransferase [Parvibaculum sp.]MBO6668253.1 methylated-DNA--[protein]-cysteine S-methyltransferase [Parvibaculum sp.]MBO6690997.1 methylated-DNA--[protein]-cysteine S-methyltransferase [Parvibaculum sp.]MBO6714629.1 methylated-DNA--[protein]-cysteine S-methyltransferase [Parvibaculum sp.]|tara:strand:- start:723 stop:1238 length:516 start_codon:yes stop_codon:yes gene_type:complete